MEETDFDIVFGPSTIIVNKQSLRVEQADFGTHQFEMHRLFADVMGAALVPFGEIPITTPSPPNSAGLIALCAMFGSIAYAARVGGLGDVDFILPAFLAGLCFVVILNRNLGAVQTVGQGFGLRIRIRSGTDLLIPSSDPKQAQQAVAAINTLIFRGAYYRRVIVENGMFGMVTTLEKHTD